MLDLDGVVWLGDQPIAGASDAVALLHGMGQEVAFVTNNSFTTRARVIEKLARHDIDARDRVFTSSMAAASMIDPGARVMVCAGPGVLEELTLRGCATIDASDEGAADWGANVVVVGFHRTFDYHRMTVASTAVRNGARLVGTNTDSTYPTPSGPIPGAGSILASIVTASGARPDLAGKPHDPIAGLVRASLGEEGIVVGDRADTDGAFARAMGYQFGLVLTGVTSASDLPTDPPADIVGEDLLTLVRMTLSASREGQ